MLITATSAVRRTAPAMTAACSAPAAARPVVTATAVPGGAIRGGAVLGGIAMPGMAMAARSPQTAQLKQTTWQYTPFEFPKTAHHNSMDLGSDIRDAGSAVRTDAGRPPRGVPR